MLRKNIDSKYWNECSKHDRLWREPGRTLISFLAFIALFPFALAAQDTGSTSTCQACVFGGGIQMPLLFAGESGPVNLLSLSAGISAVYDDNVLDSSSPRASDEALSFDSHVGIRRRSKRSVVSFDYTPFFMLYRQISQFDRVNHSAGMNFSYKLTRRVSLALHDNVSYQNGVYPSLTNQEILAGPAAPISLDQIVVPYTTRTLVNTPGLDLAFAKTRRTSMTLTGVYSQLKFGHKVAGEPLYNSSGLNGGLTIQYSLTRRTSLGMSLSHQDTTYQGGQVFGNRLRSQIESAFLTLASTLSPSVSVSVSGGPQYVRTIDATSAAGRIPAILLAAGGGGIRKEVRKTALEATFYRSSNTSGGVYTTAISTTASFSVRRRLMGRWEVGSQVGLARDDTSIFQLKNGRTDGLSAGADITRPVGRGSVFHISYFNMHQMSSGALPISYNFSRDQVSVGFDYQFKALPLGR